MSRMLAVIAACLVLCMGTAYGDAIDNSVRDTTAKSQKVRFAAVLALSKSKDARAVLAVAKAMIHDTDAKIRRVAALALEKMIDANTAPDARALGLDSLEQAASIDRSADVKETAKTTLKALASLKSKGKSDKPAVFVNIDPATDMSKKAPKDAPDRVVKIVRKGIERTGYSTN